MSKPVPGVSDHAEENLAFIRRTMERTATFSAVPGRGGALMGCIGLVAAVLAAGQPTHERWLLMWVTSAALALATGVVAIRRKSARLGLQLTGITARQFAFAVGTPIFAGAVLTGGLWLHAVWALMPATWLLLYGTGAVVGGAFSIRAVRLMGVSFMAVGVAAVLTPPAWGNLWLAIGFGGLQIAFGIYIARRFGG